MMETGCGERRRCRGDEARVSGAGKSGERHRRPRTAAAQIRDARVGAASGTGVKGDGGCAGRRR